MGNIYGDSPALQECNKPIAELANGRTPKQHLYVDNIFYQYIIRA